MILKRLPRRMLFFAGIVITLLLLLTLVNFIPAFHLETSGMHKIEGNWLDVCYEDEEAAALDTFTLADSRAGELASLLGITQKQHIVVYIYDDQSVMQRKKYGLIASLLGLDWYIGDNIGTNIILTSPANPGKVHDYDNNKYAVLHELVHAYNSVLNDRMTYWVDNGLAGYLSEQKPGYPVCEAYPIPTLEQTRVDGLLSPITFSDFGGYPYSYIYIEYLVYTYSWGQVSAYAKSGDYMQEFGCNEQEIYDGWVVWAKMHYSA